MDTINQKTYHPIVLFIGDLRQGKNFAFLAWDKIKEKFSELLRKECDDIIIRDYHNLKSEFQKLNDYENKNELIPIALSEEGDSSKPLFRSLLFSILTQFNVIGIVCSSDSKNAKKLIEYIDPLSIPTLFTLASNTNLFPRDKKNNFSFLRLVPSNEQQIQLILKALQYRLGTERQLQDFINEDIEAILSATGFFFYPEGDDYVIDMRNTLKLLGYTTTKNFTNSSDIKKSTLNIDYWIIIGYSEGFKVFHETLINKKGHKPKAILLTDGCDSEETRRIAKDNAMENTVYLLSKFKTDSSIYAAHAFEVLYTTYHDIDNNFRSRYYEKLIQPISMIKDRFEEKFEINYKFKGNENVRELFDLERISFH